MTTIRAATPLRGGLDETLVVRTLGSSQVLERTLSTTNGSRTSTAGFTTSLAE